MIRHVQQQGLARGALQQIEVCFKLRGKLYLGVIGEVGIQSFDDLLEGVFFLQFVDAPILEQAPSNSSEGAHEVQHTFVGPLGQGHLPVVELDSLPPFSVIGRLAGEDWHIAVPQVHVGGAIL